MEIIWVLDCTEQIRPADSVSGCFALEENTYSWLQLWRFFEDVNA